MTRAEEHRQAVMAEVASWGLKPTGQYDGKHLVLQWTLADGSKRRFTASSTPSHWRTTLNECARIRRIMRADGLKRPEPQAAEPRSFAKYFELPKQAVRSDSVRIAALEERLGELTDLLVDLLSRGLTQASPVAQQTEPRIVPDTPRQHTRANLSPSLAVVYNQLSYGKLMKLKTINIEGISAAAISQRLARLRELGLAQNEGKSGWKLAQSAQSAQPQSQSNATVNGGAYHGQEAATSRSGASRG